MDDPVVQLLKADQPCFFITRSGLLPRFSRFCFRSEIFKFTLFIMHGVKGVLATNAKQIPLFVLKKTVIGFAKRDNDKNCFSRTHDYFLIVSRYLDIFCGMDSIILKSALLTKHNEQNGHSLRFMYNKGIHSGAESRTLQSQVKLK